MVRAFAHGRQIDPLIYFSFQPMLQDWYNKGRGMCYPVCGMVHIKEPLLKIGKSSPCGDSGFLLSPSEWSITICPTPYNRNQMCKSVRQWCDGSSDRSFMVDLLGYFSFQPVPQDWFNKGRGMCYPVCGMMHIK